MRIKISSGKKERKEDNLKFWIEGQNSFNFLQGQHVFQSWRERKEGEKKKLSELHCVWAVTYTLLLWRGQRDT